MFAHRRMPFVRARTAATAVVTGIGAAVATGVLAAPASAAGADPWAAVRQCESGGNYSINTGNGFYGAYQFTLQTWRGLGMSGLPNQAPKAVQDAAARRLAGQYGMKPWPVCGKRYGGPAPAGGGAHHVRPHAAHTPSSVRLTSRARATSSRPTGHITVSGHHADPSHHRVASRPTDPSPKHHYRVVQSYSSDDTSHWSHPRYVSAAAGDPAARVLGIRLVAQVRADVRRYQLALDRVGYHLVVDGKFGRHTRLATMHFQAKHRLVVDGLAGPRTNAALMRAVAA